MYKYKRKKLKQTGMASQKGHYVLPQRVALESNALL